MAETKRTIPQISVDAQLLYKRLKEVGTGETISYDDLDKIVGRDVRNGASGVLTTARRRCMNLDAIVFGTVRGKGLKRLSDPEIVDTGQSQLDATRRRARRAFKTLTCVQNFDALPKDAKIKHQTFASMFSALSSMTRDSAVKKVEAKVSQSLESLPLARVLAALSE